MSSANVTLALLFVAALPHARAQQPPQAPPPASEPGARPNVLLITLDTTRADALAAWGAGGVAPNLDALAAEGVVAAIARATVPLTLPSHASMMTGLYPFAHGIRGNDQYQLAPDATTAAELLRKAGWRTEAVVAATVLRAATGLDQGFERYLDVGLRRGRNRALDAERRGDAVTDLALERLAAKDPRPWFLWLHYFDPHHPYAAPDGPPMSAGRQALYDAEVHYMDAQIGRVVARLRESGALAKTWIVVCGDHGEGLARQQELTHAYLCEEGTLRVPFFVRKPDGALRGRVETLTSTADVAPTILEIAGLAPPGPIHGRSLLALLAAEKGAGPDAERAIYFESFAGWHHFRWSRMEGVIVGPMKYVKSAGDELFDFAPNAAEAGMPPPDPETKNLAAEKPDVVRALASRLAALKAEPTTKLDATAPPLPPEEKARIAELGYLSRVAGDDEAGTGIDPRVGYVTYVDMQRALTLSMRKRHDEAIEIATRIARENPKSASVAEETGKILRAAGRREEAAAAFQEALALDPDSITSSFLLGIAFRDLGELDQAAMLFERTLELSPIHLEAWIELRGIRERRGEWEPALLAHVHAILIANELDDEEDIKRMRLELVEKKLVELCATIATRISPAGVSAARAHALALLVGKGPTLTTERTRQLLSEPKW